MATLTLLFLLFLGFFFEHPIQRVEAADGTTVPESYIYFNGFVNLGAWTNPGYAYNNNTANAATKAFVGAGYSTYLVLNCSSMVIGGKIRYRVGRSNTVITTMQIDVANRTGAWVNVYSGTPSYTAYANASFTSKRYTAIRIRFYNSGTASRTASIYEVQAVNSAYFVPNVLVDFSRWDSVFRIPSIVIAGARYNIYNITNGLEMEVILTKKVSIPSITFSFQGENLIFYYQPPLTQELNVTLYDFVNATHAIRDEQVIVYRPLNVVGSYAVYSSHLKNNEYGTGKLFHIYTPYLIDALGKISWASITIVGNYMAISFNQTFLNSASYPVILDPTFGYTTIGGTPYTNTWAVAAKFTASESGSVTKLSVYGAAYSGTTNVAGAIYSDNSGVINARLAYSSGVSVDTTPSWDNMTLSLDITSNTIYWLAHLPQAAYNFYYDAGSTNQGGFKAMTYPTFDNPFGTASYASMVLSIFATYTVSGGATYTRTASQAIGFALSTSRKIVVGRTATKTFTFAFSSTRLRQISKTASEAFTFAFGSTRLTDLDRVATQAFGFAFDGERLINAVRTASQSIVFAFGGERVATWLRSVSQTISFAFSSFAETIATYIRDAAITFTTVFGVTRLIDAARSASQSIVFAFNSERLVEYFRSASQSIGFAFSVDALKTAVGNFLRDAAITLGFVFSGDRLTELSRTVSETIVFTFNGERVVEYLRNVYQSITLVFDGERIVEYLRSTSQTLGFVFNSGKLVEYGRSVSQTITFAFNSLGETVGNAFRSAGVAFTFVFNGERIVDAARSASQSMTFVFDGEKVFNAIRSATQSISFAFDGERVVEFLRSISQTISFAFNSLGEFSGHYYRTASITINTLFDSTRVMVSATVEYATKGYVYGVAMIAVFTLIPFLIILLRRR